MRTLIVFLFGASLVVAGCASSGGSSAADEAAIRKVDSDMVAAGNAHNVDAWLSFLAPDAQMLPPGAPPIVGKEAIRNLAMGLMSPEFHVAHHLDSVVISRGGDMAYVAYTYELTFKGPAGTPVTEKGKDMDISIYRKAQDGAWKVAIDIWNDGEPPPSK